MDGNTVKDARIALGGVAHKPWRSHAAEQVLNGHPLTDANLRTAASAAVADARAQRDNAFKIELAQRAIVRAVNQAAGRAGGVA
jgi:xanthine dehydrogenase YagS FAD-binding subunit